MVFIEGNVKKTVQLVSLQYKDITTVIILYKKQEK